MYWLGISVLQGWRCRLAHGCGGQWVLRMVTVQRLYGSELEKKTAPLIFLAQVCVPLSV